MTLARPLIVLPAGQDRLWRLHPAGRLEVLEDEPALEVPVTGERASGSVQNSAGWLVVAVQEGRGLQVFRIEAGRIERRLFLSVPPGYQVLCCVVRGSTLFAGGSMTSGEPWPHDTIALLRGDLAASDCALQPIPLPPEVLGLRKAIDDLAIIDNELVALDDIVIPKFILRFDLADLPDLRYLGRESFAHGTYESAHRLVAGDGWAAVLSSTIGMGGSSRHVALWLMPYWRPVAVLSLHHPMFGGGSTSSEEWPRIAGLGDWLLVESTTRGVGAVNVPGLLARWRRTEPLDKEGHRRPMGLDPEADVTWFESWGGPITGIDDTLLLATSSGALALLDDSAIHQRVAAHHPDGETPGAPPD